MLETLFSDPWRQEEKDRMHESTDEEFGQMQQELHALHHAGQCISACPWCLPKGGCSWCDQAQPSSKREMEKGEDNDCPF